MPKYCKFDEDVKFHRSVSQARQLIDNGASLYGVLLRNKSCRTLYGNILWLYPLMDNVATIQRDNDIIWCTKDEYDYNWKALASVLLQSLHINYVDTSAIRLMDISDMPKYSIGVTYDLDVVLRDNSGRWVYLNKSDDTLQMCVSNIAPTGKVMCRLGHESLHRKLSPHNYWTAVRHGEYVIVRPPVDCPTDIYVPFGGILNSRYVYNGKNSYVRMSDYTTHTVIVDGDTFQLNDLPAMALYGQLVLHEDDNHTYYTLKPIYPDVMGGKLTHKFENPRIVAYEYNATTFCSSLHNYIQLDTRRGVYVDCLVGTTLPRNHADDPSMPTYHGYPTSPSSYAKYFYRDNDGIERAYYARILHVDADGNKTFTYIDDDMARVSMSHHMPFNIFSCTPLYIDGVNYVWDERNAAWIDEERAQRVPDEAQESRCDVYTHRMTLHYTTCPVCHTSSAFAVKYTLYYLHNHKIDHMQICSECVKKATADGLRVDTPTGEHLTLYHNIVHIDSSAFAMNDCWVDNAPDGTHGFIMEYATWDNDANTWKAKDETDTPYTFTLTDHGYYIQNKYCNRVYDYFYKPVPSFFKDTNDSTSKFLGIELEVMDGGESNNNARRVCNGHAELYAKHDGSLVRGLELVSHPCTVHWHLNNLWASVLNTLRSLNYKARSGSGIHVHVSKKYWEDNGGIGKIANLITFCDLNREAMRIYANRSALMFDRWTHSYLSPSATKKAIRTAINVFGDTDKALKSLYDAYYNNSEHYCIVNLCNCATIEIRAFASTLNINRMHSIIQFVDVITELSTQATLTHPITFNRIKERATEKGYVELLSDRKFTAAITEANRVDTTRA